MYTTVTNVQEFVYYGTLSSTAALLYCGAAVKRLLRRSSIAALFYCGALGAVDEIAPQLEHFYTVPLNLTNLGIDNQIIRFVELVLLILRQI